MGLGLILCGSMVLQPPVLTLHLHPKHISLPDSDGIRPIHGVVDFVLQLEAASMSDTSQGIFLAYLLAL
jgi:hypothetical protein